MDASRSQPRNPQPQACHGRDQLAWALRHQAERGENSKLEEIASCGDKVMVAVHIPGLDQHRAWPRLPSADWDELIT